VSHAGIALGNGWLIHSSGSRAGVTISNLATYWPSGLAFGRRVSALR
jgi:cell wall-associated NlpC family hydrolase